jgi:hypothetical protein
MKRRLAVMFVVALVAEVGTSFWVWGRYPTDSVRTWYGESFRLYEAERLTPWAIIFAATCGVWVLFSKRTRK